MVARSVLPLFVGLLLLAGCSSGTRTEDGVLGARGSTVNTVRGADATSDDVLRPEPGNIWSEGLQSSQAAPTR